VALAAQYSRRSLVQSRTKRWPNTRISKTVNAAGPLGSIAPVPIDRSPATRPHFGSRRRHWIDRPSRGSSPDLCRRSCLSYSELALDHGAAKRATAEFRCPLLGVKRTSLGWTKTVAFDPKRTSSAKDCCCAKRPLNPIPPIAKPCCNRLGGVAKSGPLGRQCDDAISFKELSARRPHGRSRRARKKYQPASDFWGAVQREQPTV